MSASIRVLIVDDHFLPRLAVTTLLSGQPDIEVVGQADTGWQAVDLYKRLRPDVVLLDMRLPEMDGVAVLGALRREAEDVHVLFLSHYDTEEDVHRASTAGALGYVKKDVDGAVLLQAIREVSAGRRYWPDSVLAQLAERLPGTTLTRREVQVLKLVHDGQSNAEVAAALGISEGTVRIHMSNISVKLGVKRRAEAVAVALKRGFLRLE